MKNIVNRSLVTLLLMLISISGFAQAGGMPPSGGSTPPPPPPNPQSGDIGSMTQPIDMYLFWLLLVGVAIIVAVVRKQKQLRNI